MKRQRILRKTAVILGLVLCMGAMLSFASCKYFQEYTIRDITDIRDEYPIRIQATFNDEYEGSCEINDAEVIKQIVDLLHERTYEYTSLPPYPGTNRSLTLIYADGQEVHFGTRQIQDAKGSGAYSPNSRDDVDAIIGKFGIEAGTVKPR